MPKTRRPHSVRKRFAEALREARTNSGLTQEQLGLRIGVARSTVERWETGVTYPIPINLRDLAEALNVEIDVLYG